MIENEDFLSSWTFYPKFVWKLERRSLSLGFGHRAALLKRLN